MSLKVFGCPGCQQPFQVASAQAGQVVQCPSCAQTVEIPANAFAPEPTPPLVFQCPACTGQFGVNPDMDGQQVACPHCQTAVQIQIPKQSVPEPSSPMPEIDTQMGRRKEKLPDDAPELFAPGFDKGTTKAPEKESPKKTQPEKRRKAAAKSRPPAAPAGKPDQKTASDNANPKPISVNRRKKTSQAERKKSSGSKKTPNTPTPNPPRPSKVVSPSNKKEASGTSAETSQSSPEAVAPVFTEVEASPTDPISNDVSKNEANPSSAFKKPEIENANLSTEEPTIVEDSEPQGFQPENIDHLLPPKFDVLDPNQLNFQTSSQAHKILLPDGEGGTSQLDKRVLRVQHGENHVSLVALTPEQRKRRRTIQNVIAILIGIGILAVVFSMLANS